MNALPHAAGSCTTTSANGGAAAKAKAALPVVAVAAKAAGAKAPAVAKAPAAKAKAVVAKASAKTKANPKELTRRKLTERLEELEQQLQVRSAAPVAHEPGWYKSHWEPERFDAMLPKDGDTFEVLILNDDTSRLGTMEFQATGSPVPHLTGAVASVVFRDAKVESLKKWGQQMFKGGAAGVHFCRT